MEARAVLRYSRISPRKVRLVIDLIRGKNAEEAMNVLKFTPRRAARIIYKVLKSAVANATQKEIGDVDSLHVTKAHVDVGPTMKRMRPRAMGRANTILKRTSHITLVVGAEEEHPKTNLKVAVKDREKQPEEAHRQSSKRKRGEE